MMLVFQQLHILQLILLGCWSQLQKYECFASSVVSDSANTCQLLEKHVKCIYYFKQGSLSTLFYECVRLLLVQYHINYFVL